MAVPAKMRGGGGRAPGGASFGEAHNLGGGVSSGESGLGDGCCGGGDGDRVLVGVQGGGAGAGEGNIGEVGGGVGGLVLGRESPPLLVLVNRRRSGGPFGAEDSPEKAHVSLLGRGSWAIREKYWFRRGRAWDFN